MNKGATGKVLTRFGFMANIFFAGIMLLVYLAAFVPSDRFWPAAFLSFLYPYLLAINLLFIIFYASLKSKKLLLSLGIILVGYHHLFNFIQPLPNFGSPEKGLKILTYNVHHFSTENIRNQASSPRILDYLRKENADIVCLQETRLFKSGRLSPDKIREALPGITHYHLAHSISTAGPMTLSKFPIVNMGEIRFEKSANMVLYSDIRVRPGQIVRVYNCHLQSYRITPEDYSLTDPGKTGTNEQQLREARMISRKMKLAFTFRARQARTVADHVKKCPYPIIVCGDFNDTPLSYTYHILSKELNDAFSEAGFGISNTYIGFLPLFRIDYILHSKRFKATSYQSERVALSDHFPVVAVMEWVK
jgi:endonuclease/exonuclease/phosphatase family metal-dependent hydrolase